MERIIKVTGKGKISVKPDMIRLMLTLKNMEKTYDETLEQSTVQAEMLRDCFEKIGFERTDLKTLHFNFDTEYESYQEKKIWKRKLIGYKFIHNMKIEFDADNKRLGQVLDALAKANVSPEFRIIYTIKDEENAKNKLLGEAVSDSKEKAYILAEAAGVKLGDIVTLDYSWGEISFTSEPMTREFLSPIGCYEDSCDMPMNIEPDNIDVSDTVTVIWKIA